MFIIHLRRELLRVKLNYIFITCFLLNVADAASCDVILERHADKTKFAQHAPVIIHLE